jgi:hypothetical protein
MKGRTIVYRFKKKIGGSWQDVMEKDGTPLTLKTDKPVSSVKHILKALRPDVAYSHNVMGFEVWPDMEATKKIEDYKQEKEEQSRWWDR